MTREVSFTAIYENVEGGWVHARVRELPEVITAAPSLEEAKELLLDALLEYLRSLGADEERRLKKGAAVTEGEARHQPQRLGGGRDAPATLIRGLGGVAQLVRAAES